MFQAAGGAFLTRGTLSGTEPQSSSGRTPAPPRGLRPPRFGRTPPYPRPRLHTRSLEAARGRSAPPGRQARRPAPRHGEDRGRRACAGCQAEQVVPPPVRTHPRAPFGAFVCVCVFSV